ncbi:hypothetical protein JMJ77_0005483 [Colletotrichum scovillei]|uniref:Uncharacterized protein n=1 Tax=Colletotrichum scovillei TaxID=1209932 RepID=A0A9P7UI92_9PEZI|nr:hypothetical protein JMJ77_0005483 [Colletotrichum scovillei]KAG7076706.1 hypothetical protein JMJ76_0013966 [Colletotrichum scovillei]KAG7083903.1 hypothetical protein JMJ78_0009344 [Colletotrichum scovillei]
MQQATPKSAARRLTARHRYASLSLPGACFVTYEWYCYYVPGQLHCDGIGQWMLQVGIPGAVQLVRMVLRTYSAKGTEGREGGGRGVL